MTTQKQFLERVSELQQKNTDLIAENGKLKQTIGENERAHSEELNQYLQAGMLLMRECCVIGGTPGIKELTPYIDKGILGLTPETLTLLARAVLGELKKQRGGDPESSYGLFERWFKLAVSKNPADNKKVTDALRARGVKPVVYASWLASMRAVFLSNEGARP